MSWIWTFSNRLEMLADRLAEQWRAHSSPWALRRVIVPSRAVGFWLQHYLAKSLGVCTAVEWLTPSALTQLMSQESPIAREKSQPSLQELTVTLFGTLRAELSRVDAAAKNIWAPLAGALGCEERREVDEERLFRFCRLLAGTFQQYSEFGSLAVRPWLEPSSNPPWQGQLWRAAFGTEGPWCSLFESSARIGAELIRAGERARANCQAPAERPRLDIFALRFLSNAHCQLLVRAAASWQIEVFALSPCRYYWSDVRSPRESKRLLRWIASQGASASTLEAFEETLRHSHPLLASLGKVGRRFVEKSELRGVQTLECYALSRELATLPPYRELWQQDLAQIQGGRSLLERLQADLLLMREPTLSLSDPATEIPLDRAVSDGTIQIHCAFSRAREVEIACSLIQGALTSDSTLSPNDISLVAPEVEEYRALLQSALDAGDCPIDCQTLETPGRDAEGFWRSFDQLLQMSQNGWGAGDLCSALENRRIRQSLDLGLPEMRWLVQLVQTGRVEWGLDADHRARVLRDEKGAAFANAAQLQTWRAFHAALLRGLARQEQESAHVRAQLDPSSPEPLFVEDLAGSAEILKKWFSWFERATQQLMPFSQEQVRPLSEWADLLVETAAALLPDSSTGDAEVKEFSRWCRQWRQKRADPSTRDASACSVPMRSTSALALLRQTMEADRSPRPLRQQAVRLIPFASGATPSRIILLLGAGEGALPKVESRQPFELGAAEGMEFSPTSSDWDRSLFLEMLLAARQKLYITYSRPAIAAEDPPANAQPCQLVAELLSALANTLEDSQLSRACAPFEPLRGRSSAHLHCVHTAESWDARYFTNSSSPRRFGEFAHRQALAGLRDKPAAPALFLSALQPGGAEKNHQKVPETWTLRELSKALGNPLEFYLQRCRLFLWGEKSTRRPWLLAERAGRALLKKQMLGKLSAIDLSPGPRAHMLARINCARWKLESERLQIPPLERGRPLEVGYELCFSRAVSRPRQMGPTSWLLPALRGASERPQISVEGEFDGDTWPGPWGLALPRFANCANSSGNFANFCRSLPYIIAHCQCAQAVGSEMRVHLGKRHWDISALDSYSWLGDLVAFANAAALTPLPLLPDWIEPLELGDAAKLTKLLTSALERSRSVRARPSTLSWIFGRSIDPQLPAFWIERFQQNCEGKLAPILARVRALWEELREDRRASSSANDSEGEP